jgi:hypothetical protein
LFSCVSIFDCWLTVFVFSKQHKLTTIAEGKSTQQQKLNGNQKILSSVLFLLFFFFFNFIIIEIEGALGIFVNNVYQFFRTVFLADSGLIKDTGM